MPGVGMSYRPVAPAERGFCIEAEALAASNIQEPAAAEASSAVAADAAAGDNNAVARTDAVDTAAGNTVLGNFLTVVVAWDMVPE